jgi:precorrin-2 dehydrogenase / sirohydrochlorin ferrochelatase
MSGIYATCRQTDNKAKHSMTFYPVYLTHLDRKHVVLLGGNHEAERKTLELLSFGAKVHLISPRITLALRRLHEEGRLRWTPRLYRYGDLVDAGFAVAADYTPETAREFALEAEERNILVNVMDNMPLSNSAFGSVVRQGKLTVSFSTSGLAPALAVRLKERFERELDDAYGRFLDLAGTLRPAIMETIRDGDLRKVKWYEWVDSETITALRAGNDRQALAITAEVWGEEVLERAGIPAVPDTRKPTPAGD